MGIDTRIKCLGVIIIIGWLRSRRLQAFSSCYDPGPTKQHWSAAAPPPVPTTSQKLLDRPSSHPLHPHEAAYTGHTPSQARRLANGAHGPKTRAGGSRPRPPARQGRLDCMQMVSPKTRPMCPMSNTTPQHDAAKASIPSSTSHDPHPQRRTTTHAVSNSPIQMPTGKDGLLQSRPNPQKAAQASALPPGL